MASADQKKSLINEPAEVARLISAFAECSAEIQSHVLEMAGILNDESSTEDEKSLAFDAIAEALWLGTSADIAQRHANVLRQPDGVVAREELREEQRSFGARVRAAMQVAGMTEEDLARRIGATPQTVGNILSGLSRPQLRTIERIAEVFGVAPDALWPGTAKG